MNTGKAAFALEVGSDILVSSNVACRPFPAFSSKTPLAEDSIFFLRSDLPAYSPGMGNFFNSLLNISSGTESFPGVLSFLNIVQKKVSSS